MVVAIISGQPHGLTRADISVHCGTKHDLHAVPVDVTVGHKMGIDKVWDVGVDVDVDVVVLGGSEVDVDVEVEVDLLVDVLVGVKFELEDVLEVLDDVLEDVDDGVDEVVESSSGNGGQVGMESEVVEALDTVIGVKVIGGSAAGNADTALCMSRS